MVSSASISRGRCIVKDDDSVWIQGEYSKEKLRVRERYWRDASEILNSIVPPSSETTKDDGPTFILPDALVLRKYLPLISCWIEEEAKRIGEVGRKHGSCKWILLESAVEWMDCRNTSPSVSHEHYVLPEAAAVQERSKLQKLLHRYPEVFLPFCDLSVRESDQEGLIMDEFEIMHYATMSVADRSRHAMIRAGRMIWQQTPSNNIRGKVVILSLDYNFCQQFPAEDGVTSIHFDSFIDYMIQHSMLKQEKKQEWLLSKVRCEEEYNKRNSPSLVDNTDGVETDSRHWSESEIQEGLKARELFKGRLEVTKENIKEAFVTSHGDTYFVNQALGHFNRALHQDIVVLKPLPKAQWGRPVGKRRLVHHTDDGDDTTTEVDTEVVNDMPTVPTARVVGVFQPSRRQFVATMVDIPNSDEAACLVVPMDIRIPKIRLRTHSWRNFIQKRLLIQVDEWEIDSNYPHGRCIEILGPIADLETEIKCLLLENDVVLDPFSASAMACLPPMGAEWVIPDDEILSRRDLRKSHRIFSVDPPGCQDIDDTMHARVLPNGNIEVGVHIADVTYFLRHKSPLDVEAQLRSTTFYLVDRRFDMLPTLLSSDLCSLHGGKDRLAMSTIWIMSPDLEEVKSVWYGRTIIHNCQAMTYDQAHNILHDKSPDDPNNPAPPPLTAGAPVDSSNVVALKNDLTLLTKLARKLRKHREDVGGAVDLSSGDLGGSELKFALDENNNPTRVAPKKDLEIHHTIAELMILANSSVASKIYQAFPNSALLRIHRAVEEERFDDLKEVLNAGKIEFDGSSNMALAESLKKAEQGGKSGAVVNSLFRSLATRAMSEAQYVCTGDSSGDGSLSHYGLGLQNYTHFTSPIRRYADVIVHRQLLAALTQPTSVPNAPRSRGINDRKGLTTLPESNVISILGGEGLQESLNTESGIANTNSLLNIVSEDEGGAANSTGEFPNVLNLSDMSSPYSMREVSSICERLNHQNRIAKISSRECQSLFLSLFFKDHVETAQAVVTNIRANGFWVYVPKFDMRGPVYLSDMVGNVQIDPALLGLAATAGLEPSSGFAASNVSRRFTSGRCDLVKDNEEGEYLKVTVAESQKAFIVRALDVLTIQVMCLDWDVRARIPAPRLHLLASSASYKQTGGKPGKRPGEGMRRGNAASTTKQPSQVHANQPTIYGELTKLTHRPILEGVPLRSPQSSSYVPPEADTTSTIAGRIAFCQFVNPDTRSATQEAAIEAASEAAAQRRVQVMARVEQNNEYYTTRQIEKDATARAQRLAASKRNARKGKGK